MDATQQMGVTNQTARAILIDMKQLGIVHDIAGDGKERLYVYTQLIEILEKGTEPIGF